MSGNTEATKPTCINCRFWGSFGDDENGQCRINPPVIHAQLIHLVDEIPIEDGMWPWTLHNDWCGRFEVLVEAVE
jgi:hypothetical protein